MPPKKNAVQDFFDNLPDEDKQEADVFEVAPKAADNAGKDDKGDKGNDDEDGHKNRRHRRLEAALEREKEARIAAEARAQALSESGTKVRESDKEIDGRLLRIFGDTPEAKQAGQLFQDIIGDYSKQAREDAIKEFNETRLRERKEQAQFESFIDSELEGIEDEFNVDVTSNTPAARKSRREFLEIVQNLSPKDEQGEITGYADFSEAWKMYQLKRGSEKSKETSDRQKDLASRSMEKSGGGNAVERKGPTPGFFGWKKDLGL